MIGSVSVFFALPNSCKFASSLRCREAGELSLVGTASAASLGLDSPRYRL